MKSKRGVEFRRWANFVLKQYILKGYAVNDNRIKQLGEVIRIIINSRKADLPQSFLRPFILFYERLCNLWKRKHIKISVPQFYYFVICKAVIV
ncbi:MAG: virulence RhuM family protein [Lachnospiraceae bacterium]|nr:virulence RhuM family protein [Lachnospiraceae bacterium]